LRLVVVIMPFGLAAAATYFALLTEFDINFYLKEKPPVFVLAVSIGVVILLALTAVLLWLLSGWVSALPLVLLVLLEDAAPWEALRQSHRRAGGRRVANVLWILGWSLVMVAVTTVATGAVSWIGRWLFPGSNVSLRMLATFVGTFVVAGGIVNLAVSVLSSTTLSLVLYHLYRSVPADEPRPVDPLRFGRGAEHRDPFKITTPRLVAAAVVGVLIAAIIGASVVASLRLEERVHVMAHRGFSKSAPENTLAAIRQAIDARADYVEIDVQETADGTVVVLHDSDLMKIAGNSLKIWDAKLSDLKDIDIGSWFKPEFKDERVPTLADVLKECRGKIRVNIELKYYGHDQQLEQRVAELVESHGMEHSIVVMSLSLDGVRKMQAIRPHWKAGLLMSVATGDLRKLDVDFIAVNASFVSRALIEKAHSSGKEIYAWTVNDPLLMSNLIARGIDGVLTDDPQLARSVLQQRAEMTVLERLLLDIAGRLGMGE
jgi:glycerophosphoryl diester phosphodiesterase